MSDRDEELVRYVLNVAESSMQEEAWEAFNRITSELAEARELLGEALSSLEDLYHGGGSDDCHDCELYRRIDAFLERKP